MELRRIDEALQALAVVLETEGEPKRSKTPKFALIQKARPDDTDGVYSRRETAEKAVAMLNASDALTQAVSRVREEMGLASREAYDYVTRGSPELKKRAAETVVAFVNALHAEGLIETHTESNLLLSKLLNKFRDAPHGSYRVEQRGGQFVVVPPEKGW